MDYRKPLKAIPRIIMEAAEDINETKVCAIVLYGDTYSIKDQLKALGARFTDQYPGSIQSSDTEIIKRWVIKVSGAEFKAVKTALKELGFEVEPVPQSEMILFSERRNAAEKKAAEDKATHTAIEEAPETKEDPAAPKNPEYPAEFESLRGGAFWNGKIYGRKGAYSVYFDGNKTNISDDLRDAVIKVQEMKGDTL